MKYNLNKNIFMLLMYLRHLVLYHYNFFENDKVFCEQIKKQDYNNHRTLSYYNNLELFVLSMKANTIMYSWYVHVSTYKVFNSK